MRKAIQFISILLIVSMLALPVSAEVRPSVEQKGAPTVVEQGVTATSLADLDKAPAEVKEAVEEAAKVITEAKTLDQAVPTMAQTLKEMKADVKVENLVVRDLFHVSLDKELAAGEEKTITFKADGLKKTDFLLVMVYVDGEWVILDRDKVEITKDGQVKVTFDVVGPVAFVTEK